MKEAYHAIEDNITTTYSILYDGLEALLLSFQKFNVLNFVVFYACEIAEIAKNVTSQSLLNHIHVYFLSSLFKNELPAISEVKKIGYIFVGPQTREHMKIHD